MEEYKDKTLEELKEIREEFVQAWIIQRSEYQEEELEKVNEEIEKRKTKQIRKVIEYDNKNERK